MRKRFIEFVSNVADNHAWVFYTIFALEAIACLIAVLYYDPTTTNV